MLTRPSFSRAGDVQEVVTGGTAEMFVQPACLNCHSERDHNLRL